jgi:hypothetical protein
MDVCRVNKEVRLVGFHPLPYTSNQVKPGYEPFLRAGSKKEEIIKIVGGGKMRRMFKGSVWS